MLDSTNEQQAKVNWDRLDTPIEYAGRAITLPGDPSKMPTEKAIEALKRKLDDENQEYRVHEVIDAYPLDAAVACTKAMANLYGWASAQTEIIQGFFGKQKKPPEMVSVKVGVKDEDVIQCPMGRFMLPGIEAPVNTVIFRGYFIIHAEVKKKDKHLVLELATETRRIVKEHSIYRGKAIRLGVDEDGDLDVSNPPIFLDVTSNDILIFDDDIQSQIDHSVLAPIVYRTESRKVGVPFKRGVLFYGRYGTGKTLLARAVARICEQKGVTFVLLDKVQGLKAALEFANRYAPAVVFAEDVDRITEVRDDEANDLCNTIDGVVSKTSQIMTLLTTNHVDKINQVMLRPGRLDAIIELRAPSDEAVQRLLRYYAGDLLPVTADITAAAKELSGQIPATIRECVERAKLGMVWRRDTKLNDTDLVTAAKTMKNHLTLLNRETNKPTAAERLAESLHEVVGNGSTDMLSHISKVVEEINATVN